MIKRLSSSLILSLLLATGVAHAASPPPAPADSLATLSFKGSQNLGPAYDSSHLKAVLDASTFPKFYRELLPQLLEKSLANDPAAAEHLATALTALQQIAQHGFTLSLRPTTDPNSPVSLTLATNAEEDADALEKLLTTLTTTAGPNSHLSSARTNSTLTLTLGPPPAADAAHEPSRASSGGPGSVPAPSLSPGTPGEGQGEGRPSNETPSETHAVAPDPHTLPSSPQYQSALKHVDPDPVLLFYTDVERILSLIDQKTATLPDNPWPRIKPLTGLSGLKRFIATGNFAGPSWSTRSFTHAPAPREKWLSLLQGADPATTQSLLNKIPADATYVLSAHFDPAAWINSFRPIAAAIHPEGQQKFDQALGLVSLYLGRNLTTDILAPLGSDWVAYNPPNHTPDQPKLVLISKLANEPKARDGLIALTYALANSSQHPAVKNAGFSATVANDEIDNLKINSLKFDRPLPNIGRLSPAWALHDGHLYLSTSPESLAAAAHFKGPSFPTSPHLAESRTRLNAITPTPDGASVEFVNAPLTAPHVYPILRSAADMGLAFASANAGLKLTTNPLPPFKSIEPHLHPILSTSWTTDEGFHSAGISPFPACEILTGGGSSMTTLGASAVAVSIALPSINRARETANRVKCASNMKQIGNCILLYCNENKGNYPPDLGALAITQDIAMDAFRCPSSDTAAITNHDIILKPEFRDQAKLFPEMRKRVNEQTDYIYVGQKFRIDADPDLLVLHEKPDDHNNDGLNMLFADGSVQFFRMPDAQRIITTGKRTPQDHNR